jgi:hypothetical protein
MAITIDPNATDPFEQAGGQEEVQKTLDAQAEIQAEQQQPKLLLGKFKSQDELAAAYSSLQAEYSRLKNGQQPPAEQPPATETQQPVTESAPTQTASNPPAADPGPSPEVVAALHGSIITEAGGEDRYARLSDWIGRNVDRSRIDAYNAALATADKQSATTMLKAFQFDYLAANGYEPQLAGGSFNTSNATPFQSEQQVVAAMSDPRYQGPNADPAYVAEVEARLAVSRVFNSR